MTTETPRAESLQEIERLLNEYMVQLLKRTHGTKDHRERLLSAISRVVQERKELEDRVAALVKCIDQDTESMAKDEARIAVLEKALRKYGWHNDDCPVLAICQHDNFKDSITCDHDKRCTCGYSAALAEVGQMEGK